MTPPVRSAAPARPALRLVGLMCLAETLSMTGFGAYPAFLALLRDGWGISNSQAGFIGGAYFAGYMAAVPILSGLTDRYDARRIYVGCCLIAAASNALFALAAQGALSAALFQALAGAGLAGTYMPGLKALTDRVTGPSQSRYIAFYTSTFGIGTSLSLLLAGWLGRVMEWDTAFGVLAIGPCVAGALVFARLRPMAPRGGSGSPVWGSFGALRDREVRGYVLRYALHCWELFGLRSWLVAFILFAFALPGAGRARLGATEAAAFINFLGIAASILGNEAAGRLGRSAYLPLAMGGSGILAWIAGYSAGWPWWLVTAVLSVYFVAIMSDSAALTAGLVAAVPQARRGAAMAIYSFAGFGAGFIAPLAFGAVLDACGGKDAPLAWMLAFGSLGVGCLASALSTLPRTRR